jgi:hypothetical protein
VIRLALLALRITVLLNLVSCMLFSTGTAADSLVPVHVGPGLLAVLSLWTLGFAQVLTQGGSWSLALGAGKLISGRSRCLVANTPALPTCPG